MRDFTWTPAPKERFLGTRQEEERSTGIRDFFPDPGERQVGDGFVGYFDIFRIWICFVRFLEFIPPERERGELSIFSVVETSREESQALGGPWGRGRG